MKIKNTYFMLKKIVRDFINTKEGYEISDDLTSSKLGNYYFIFKEERVSKGKDQALINPLEVSFSVKAFSVKRQILSFLTWPFEPRFLDFT